MVGLSKICIDKGALQPIMAEIAQNPTEQVQRPQSRSPQQIAPAYRWHAVKGAERSKFAMFTFPSKRLPAYVIGVRGPQVSSAKKPPPFASHQADFSCILLYFNKSPCPHHVNSPCLTTRRRFSKISSMLHDDSGPPSASINGASGRHQLPQIGSKSHDTTPKIPLEQ